MKINKWGIILLFLISFYLVEFGPFSSMQLAKHNNGYGTFDMKDYNLATVQEVLSTMDSEGFVIARNYYLCDGFFVVMLFIVEYQLGAFIAKKINVIFIGMNIIAGMRGIMDFIENILLSSCIHSFPKINERIVFISGVITRVKFLMMGIWILMLVSILLWKGYVALKKIELSLYC